MAAKAETKSEEAAGVIGSGPFKVSPALYRDNRAKLVARMRDAGHGASAAAVFQGGSEAMRHDTDHEDLFRQESTFLYLFGVNEPNFFGFVDVERAESVLCIPRLGESWEMWCGERKSTEWYRKTYGVDAAIYADEMADELERRGVRTVHTMRGVNADSGAEFKPAAFDGKDKFEENDGVLYNEVAECRVIKTEAEIEALRYIVEASSKAHIDVMHRVRPGMYEYQLESLFFHHVSFHGGSRYLAYTCICCAGTGAILHYGHAGAPNAGLIGENDMCLLDMGAEYHGFCSDITCSYPSSGKFSDDQRMVYEAVLDAQRRVEDAMRPGVKWADMHHLAERAILEHLVRAGIVVENGKTLDQLHDELHIPATFMPHGLGHFMGLDTHDVGGYLDGAERPTRPGACNLRTTRTLKAGMVLTVEPGCYFIGYLLDKALADPAVAPHLNADLVERFRSFGGVRLEDDVVVTADGIENMTKVPRTIAEVEACMAEGRKRFG